MERGGRRERSKAVAIPAVTFLAAGILASCGRYSERRACVDSLNRVIDERSCTTRGGIGRYYYYRGGHAGFGSHLSGGSFTRGGSSFGHSGGVGSIGRGGFGGGESGG